MCAPRTFAVVEALEGRGSRPHEEEVVRSTLKKRQPKTNANMYVRGVHPPPPRPIEKEGELSARCAPA